MEQHDKRKIMRLRAIIRNKHRFPKDFKVLIYEPVFLMTVYGKSKK